MVRSFANAKTEKAPKQINASREDKYNQWFEDQAIELGFASWDELANCSSQAVLTLVASNGEEVK